MIWAILSAKGALSLRNGWWLLIVTSAALAALAGLYFWLGARETADDNANQEIGAAVQREGDLREVINRTGKANDAESKITTDPDARRAGCVRHSRTPANC